MTRHLRGLSAAILALALVVIVPPARVDAGIGPYTYPFYTNRTMTNEYGPSTSNYGPGHGYPHWHNGIDWGMPIGTDVAASRQGTVGNLKEDLRDGEVGPFGLGNYVFVEHEVDRHSLYYHLTKNGVLFPTGAKVSAGEHIAESGDTGMSTGPHLHYSLMMNGTCQSSTCDVDPRSWTTDPGRVPYRGAVSARSHSGTVYIEAGKTLSFSVTFKNTGGRTWQGSNDSLGNGRLLLYAVDASGTKAINSPFAAADWESASNAGTMNQSSVGPDGLATFAFGLKGTVAGSYPGTAFNLRPFDLHWFNHDAIGNFSLSIVVWENCTPCP